MRKAEARCGDETRAGLVKFTRWIGRKTPGEPDRKGASALGAVGCRSPLPRQGVSIAADVSGHLPETDAGTGARRLWGAVPTGAGAGAEVFAATAGPDGEGRRNGGATSAGNSGAPVICRALVGNRGAYRSRRPGACCQVWALARGAVTCHSPALGPRPRLTARHPLSSMVR